MQASIWSLMIKKDKLKLGNVQFKTGNYQGKKNKTTKLTVIWRCINLDKFEEKACSEVAFHVGKHISHNLRWKLV